MSIILFVDDDPITIEIIRRNLRNESFTCLFAFDAKSAIQLLQEHPVDCIVTDLLMPEMNGYELLTLLKERYPHIIRMILTGCTQVAPILSALEHGPIFHIFTKPVIFDQNTIQFLYGALYQRRKQQQFQTHLIDVLIKVMTNPHEYWIYTSEGSWYSNVSTNSPTVRKNGMIFLNPFLLYNQNDESSVSVNNQEVVIAEMEVEEKRFQVKCFFICREEINFLIFQSILDS